jgi:cytochrome P450
MMTDIANAPADLPTIASDCVLLEELAAARRQSWAARSARGLEVLRFREGLIALDHPDLEKGASFKRRLDDLGIVSGKIRDDWNQMLVTTEGAHRHHLRTPLAALFRGSQVNKLKRSIRAIVDQVLDEIPDRTAVDFMRDVAWKIPPRVYCHLVSAPIEDAPLVAKLSDSTLAPILTADVSRRQESIDAFNATCEFVRNHLDQRRRQGDLGDDFTSLMIRQQQEGLQTEDELIFEGAALLQASVDNTVHQIGLTFGTLLEEPARWQTLLDQDNLIPSAVEEVMRLRPRFGTIFRYAARDTELEDVAVPAGSWVFVSVRSANRDETMFDDPDAFRFDRRIGRALQFGAGPYNCLGQTLARLELHEVLGAVRERFPDIKLAGDWSRHDSNAVTETARLHVTL